MNISNRVSKNRFYDVLSKANFVDYKSIEGQKRIAISLLNGENYRSTTEKNAQNLLTVNYIWIYEQVVSAKKLYGKNWQIKLLDKLHSSSLSKQESLLKNWLIGMTMKTLENNELKDPVDARRFLLDRIAENKSIIKSSKTSISIDELWLMLMAGHSTMTVRGSLKSSVGKSLEHSFLVSLFSILGLTYNKDFFVSIDGDTEIHRQFDAEIKGDRRNYLVDLGLIADGNPEVISDKVTRVGEKNLVIFDKLSPQATTWSLAASKGVELVQIRNNQPIVAVHNYLKKLNVPSLNSILIANPPTTRTQIEQMVLALPDSIFKKTK